MDRHSIHRDRVRLCVKSCIRSGSQAHGMHDQTPDAAIPNQAMLPSFSLGIPDDGVLLTHMLQERIRVLGRCLSS